MFYIPKNVCQYPATHKNGFKVLKVSLAQEISENVFSQNIYRLCPSTLTFGRDKTNKANLWWKKEYYNIFPKLQYIYDKLYRWESVQNVTPSFLPFFSLILINFGNLVLTWWLLSSTDTYRYAFYSFILQLWPIRYFGVDLFSCMASYPLISLIFGYFGK